MKTYQPKQKDIKRNWYLVDAKEQVLGRLSTEIARYLIGKHKVNYSAHMDSGDYVVVINAKEVKVTGRKYDQKLYRRHSGYPGGFREVNFKEMLDKHPVRIIELAVSGMVPDNRLKKDRMARLKVFEDGKHPYGDKFQDIAQGS
jgi:large subunit ribosomal protein L13